MRSEGGGTVTNANWREAQFPRGEVLQEDWRRSLNRQRKVAAAVVIHMILDDDCFFCCCGGPCTGPSTSDVVCELDPVCLE